MTRFAPVDGLHGVYVARLGKLNCVALRLRDDSLCLYSPVAGLETHLLEQVGELGRVSALLAPNHYHNKGLAAHRSAFPGASLHCTTAAKPRLTKITGLDFEPLDDLAPRLRAAQTLHEPPGLKTGEVWVEINAGADRALIVTDAFNAAAKAAGVFAEEAGLLGTFPNYGVKDATTYKSWAVTFLSERTPTMLLPCHGAPVRSASLATQLITVLEDAF
ncbi:MAG: hypothetical protein AAFY80_16380 [Pseudomonadota bacterium]